MTRLLRQLATGLPSRFNEVVAGSAVVGQHSLRKGSRWREAHGIQDHLDQPSAGPDLWASVVALRLGFDEDEALTPGKALAGLNAQAKGRRLGIFKPHEEKPKKAREKEPGERFLIEVCGRPVPAKNTEEGIRAVRGAKTIEPEGC